MNKNSPRRYLAMGQEVPKNVCLNVCKKHFDVARYILASVVVEEVVAENSTTPRMIHSMQCASTIYVHHQRHISKYRVMSCLSALPQESIWCD